MVKPSNSPESSTRHIAQLKRESVFVIGTLAAIYAKELRSMPHRDDTGFGKKSIQVIGPSETMPAPIEGYNNLRVTEVSTSRASRVRYVPLFRRVVEMPTYGRGVQSVNLELGKRVLTAIDESLPASLGNVTVGIGTDGTALVDEHDTLVSPKVYESVLLDDDLVDKGNILQASHYVNSLAVTGLVAEGLRKTYNIEQRWAVEPLYNSWRQELPVEYQPSEALHAGLPYWSRTTLPVLLAQVG
jgi:hypothetical protein